MATDLVVALDFNEQATADHMIDQLQGMKLIYKVGLELYLSADPKWVENLCVRERVFLDLKLYDIPTTVAAAMVRIAKLGAEFTTVHLSGGRRMLDEIDIRFQEAMLVGEISKRPKVLGVSVLTSFKEEDWIANVSHMAKLTGIRSIEDTAMHFANLVHDHPGVQGMVCSPQEIESIKRKYPDVYLMVPGIRPEGTTSHDQNRVMTPKNASALGASALVMGRPITQNSNPRAVVEQVLQDIK